MILHGIATTSLAYGGPVTALNGLTAAQSYHETVGIAFQDDAGTGLRAEFSPKVTMLPLSLRGFASRFKLDRSLEPMISDAEVVHLHGVWEPIQCALANVALRLGVPYIVRPCGMLDPWSLRNRSYLKKLAYLRLLLRRILQHAAAIHFTTQREADLAAKFCRPEQVIVEPNGIDLAAFQTQLPVGYWQKKTECGDRLPILFLSRVAPKKGLDLLLPALARLHSDRICLWIAGPDEGGYLQAVKQQVSELGLDKQVSFLGPLEREERAAAYRDAELFALTSYQENFGNVVLEAMACELPVLISDQVNLCDAVLAAEAGVVVPCQVDAIATALEELVSDKQRRENLAKNGRQLADEGYSWQAIASRWTTHYERLTASS